MKEGKNMDLKEFGLFLANLRERNGYKSQRKLAEISGISNGSIARIESGTQKPQPETLKALSNHLKGITYEELLEKAGYLTKSENNFLGDLHLTEDELIYKYKILVDGQEASEDEVKEAIKYLKYLRQNKN